MLIPKAKIQGLLIQSKISAQLMTTTDGHEKVCLDPTLYREIRNTLKQLLIEEPNQSPKQESS